MFKNKVTVENNRTYVYIYSVNIFLPAKKDVAKTCIICFYLLFVSL